MGFKSFREESRTNFGTNDEKLSLEQVNTGAFLRMADAMEKMAGNYTKLENDLKWYQKNYPEKNAEIVKLKHSNAALRGHIKRLKKLNNK